MPVSGMIVGTSCCHGNILFTVPSNADIQLQLPLRPVTLRQKKRFLRTKIQIHTRDPDVTDKDGVGGGGEEQNQLVL